MEERGKDYGLGRDAKRLLKGAFRSLAQIKSICEIATLLGMSKSTAWQHLAYARAKLIQQYLRAQGLLGNGR